MHKGMTDVDVVYRMVQCFAVMVQQIHFCDHNIFMNRLYMKSMFEESYVIKQFLTMTPPKIGRASFLKLLLTAFNFSVQVIVVAC